MLTSEQIRTIDAATLNGRHFSLTLMKTAANASRTFFMTRCPEKKQGILIFAGTGNNGGMPWWWRKCSSVGYRVKVAVGSGWSYTEDCSHNLRLGAEQITCNTITSEQDLPVMEQFDCLSTDLGTGLSREVEVSQQSDLKQSTKWSASVIH